MDELWKPDIVIYHHPCADGFGAAWAIWMKWPEATFIPANYGDAPPNVQDKKVLIVDFSYKADVLAAMELEAHSVVILDHHKTAQADLDGFIDVTLETGARFRDYILHECRGDRTGVLAFFDMNRSGARLAWEFAFGTEPPLMIRLIEDRDLWRFNYPETKAFALWLRLQAQSFVGWRAASDQLDRNPEPLYSAAFAMLKYHEHLVEKMCDAATWTKESGFKVPTVYCDGAFASDVGNALLKRFPEAPFSRCFTKDGNTLRVSLRSEDGRQDVCEIAKRNGGGGHRNAAGYAQTFNSTAATSIGKIIGERLRQVESEGYTHEHDDDVNADGQLVAAAACYAISALTSARPEMAMIADKAITFWFPWRGDFWKPGEPMRDLVKAGALIVAEIERLQRKSEAH